MKTELAKVGKGFVFGITHPFKEKYYLDRYSDTCPIKDKLLDELGVSLGQGIFVSVYGPVTALAILCAIGYVSRHVKNMPVKFEMVRDK